MNKLWRQDEFLKDGRSLSQDLGDDKASESRQTIQEHYPQIQEQRWSTYGKKPHELDHNALALPIATEPLPAVDGTGENEDRGVSPAEGRAREGARSPESAGLLTESNVASKFRKVCHPLRPLLNASGGLIPIPQVLGVPLLFLTLVLVFLSSTLLSQEWTINNGLKISILTSAPSLSEHPLPGLPPPPPWIPDKRFIDDPALAATRKELSKDCDLSVGQWVYDPSNYPLWPPGGCEFVERGFECHKLGRTNLDFMHFRWQPRDCRLPRFDAEEMRWRLSGHRVAFIGDSLGRNQFQSLLCLLSQKLPQLSFSNSSLPSVYEVNNATMGRRVQYLAYEFTDYNFTVEYHLSHYLVAFYSAPKGSPEKVRAVINTDVVDLAFLRSFLRPKWGKGRRVIALLNMGHWFDLHKTTGQGFYFISNGTIRMDINYTNGFQLSAQTVFRWAVSWVDSNHVALFRSYSPAHFMGASWDSGGSCRDEHPLADVDGVPGGKSWSDTLMVYREMAARVMMEANKNAESEKKRIEFLDVTGMSAYRSDAHMGPFWTGGRGFDCSHWCLPGVPDSWNEMLIWTLVAQQLL